MVFQVGHEVQHQASEIGAGIFMKSGFSRLQKMPAASKLPKTGIKYRHQKRST
jgi:hypothetical protein